jgi:surface protein
MHHIKSIRMFEDDVTWPEHALVIQEGSLGGSRWWSGICNLKNGYLLWLSQYFNQGSLAFFSRVVDCECNRPPILATVFFGASTFNGDLSQWDVTKVTNMFASKSVRILKNNLTWRELMLLCNWKAQSGVGVGGGEVKVTSMYESKSIRIFENDLTWGEHVIVIEWMGGVM